MKFAGKMPPQPETRSGSGGGGSSRQTPLPGTGLEEIGVPGQNYLRDALTSCTDPLKAIEEFQVPFLFIFRAFRF